jgi:hypothetical protein
MEAGSEWVAEWASVTVVVSAVVSALGGVSASASESAVVVLVSASGWASKLVSGSEVVSGSELKSAPSPSPHYPPATSSTAFPQEEAGWQACWPAPRS